MYFAGFAGFAGYRLGVVCIGYADNRPARANPQSRAAVPAPEAMEQPPIVTLPRQPSSVRSTSPDSAFKMVAGQPQPAQPARNNITLAQRRNQQQLQHAGFAFAPETAGGAHGQTADEQPSHGVLDAAKPAKEISIRQKCAVE